MRHVGAPKSTCRSWISKKPASSALSTSGEKLLVDKDKNCLGRWKMGWGLGTKPKDITDGLSKTMMCSEVLGWNTQFDGRGVWAANAMGSSVYVAKQTPNSSDNDNIPMCDAAIPGSDVLHCTQNRSDGKVWAAARSRHLGGVCVLYADGSVHFEADQIDPAAWTALSTRAGDETAQ